MHLKVTAPKVALGVESVLNVKDVITCKDLMTDMIKMYKGGVYFSI